MPPRCGELYRCRISHRLVLVISASKKNVRGLTFNPVTGRQETITVHPNQLCSNIGTPER